MAWCDLTAIAIREKQERAIRETAENILQNKIISGVTTALTLTQPGHLVYPTLPRQDQMD